MDSLQALEYLTSKTFTGGNSILEIEASICKEIISKDLADYNKMKTKIQNTIVFLEKKLKTALFNGDENTVWNIEIELDSLKDLLGE